MIKTKEYKRTSEMIGAALVDSIGKFSKPFSPTEQKIGSLLCFPSLISKAEHVNKSLSGWMSPIDPIISLHLLIFQSFFTPLLFNLLLEFSLPPGQNLTFKWPPWLDDELLVSYRHQQYPPWVNESKSEEVLLQTLLFPPLFKRLNLHL